MTSNANRARLIEFGVGIALIAMTALVYWPGLRSFFVSDDFFLVTYARLLQQPLALFGHEHFPYFPYFRPLGLAVWWLAVQCFGNAARPEYALNLALHCAVVLALWRLLLGCVRIRSVAWLVALLFAVHPIAIGTALWLADRFDLLATLFGVLALHATFRYRDGERGRDLVAVVVLVVLGLASKETSLVVAAVICLVWLWPRWPARWYSTSHWRASLLLAGVSVVWFGWRAWIVSIAPAGSLVGDRPLLQILGTGTLRWCEDFAHYLLAWRRLSLAARILLLACMLAVAGVAGSRLRLAPQREPDQVRDALLYYAVAAALLVLAALIQSPLAIWSAEFVATAGAGLSAEHSRLFYLASCAVALAVAVALDRCLGSSATVFPTWSTRAAIVCLVILAAIWGTAAHRFARDYRRDSETLRPIARAAVEAIGHTALPGSHCQIYLLDLPPDRVGYALRPLLDEIVKALVPQLAEIGHCLIQSEQAPVMHMLAHSPFGADDIAPLVPIYRNGLAVPWLDVGGVQVVYLNLLPGTDARALDHAVFLAYREGRFDDVSAAVRAGDRPVHFVCAQTAAQCVCPAAACPNGRPAALPRGDAGGA